MKHVVITGASRGLGRAMAIGFAADGWNVSGCGTDATSLKTLADRLRPEHLLQVCDVTDPAAVEAFAAAVTKRFGAPGLLLNNAATINPTKPLWKAHQRVVRFLTAAFTLMPAHWKLRTVRADSGFFENALLTFLEARGIAYIVVDRLTQTVKRKAAGLATWTPIDENYAWARFTLQLQGWSAPREFFAIRERIRENKSAVGRRLIDVDGYTFRVFVTNRQGDGAELWRDYNQRACCEQHIEELKNDLQADGFCMKDFYATESAFLSVCFTYNLLSLYQHASAPEQRNKAGFKRPATLRAAVFIGGALSGTRSRTPVLYIAESWGGLSKHKPLIDKIFQWPGATSPKLPPEPPGDEMANGASAAKTCAA